MYNLQRKYKLLYIEWRTNLKAKRLSKVYYKRKTYKSKWVEYIQVSGKDRSLYFGKRNIDCDIV
jgi:hypothetical protein